MLIETDSLHSTLDHIEDDTVIVFDIDNTLVTTTNYYGSEHWEKDLSAHFRSEGKECEEARSTAEGIWKAAQEEVDLLLLEEDTPALLNKMAESATVLAITSREHGLMGLTLEELERLNIFFHHFNEQCPSNQEVFRFPSWSFHKRVAFVAGTPKDEVLFHLVEQEKLLPQPKKVIFLDDKECHLEEMRQTCMKKDIPFVGLRFNLADAWHDEEKAKIPSPLSLIK